MSNLDYDQKSFIPKHIQKKYYLRKSLIAQIKKQSMMFFFKREQVMSVFGLLWTGFCIFLRIFKAEQAKNQTDIGPVHTWH